MGNIDLLYHRSQDLPMAQQPGDLWIDIGENIHMHFRDIRLEFTRIEFLEFLSNIKEMEKLFHEWAEKNPDWREADDPEGFKNQYVMWLGDFKPGSQKLKDYEAHYWPRRISIERNANGVYHFHYRNLRVELNRGGFEQLVKAFSGIDEWVATDLEQRRTEFLRQQAKADKSTPEFQGCIDDIHGARIHGWVQAVTDQKLQWELSIVAQGQEIKRVLASQYRDDLNQTHGYGHSAFDVVIPELLRYKPEHVQVFILPFQVELPKGEHMKPMQFKNPFLTLTDPTALPIDPDFFNKHVKGRPLHRVECKEIDMSALKVRVSTPKGEQLVPLKKSPVYRHLQGDKDAYEEHRRKENHLDDLIASIHEEGYNPHRLITIFNGEPIIRDGNIRAAILLYQQKPKKLNVLDIGFDWAG
jgi:hypothetical protein